MMYHYMTLNDGTEINHSEMKNDGTVKVYIEKPVVQGFQSVYCILPSYTWIDNNGFNEEEINIFDELIHSVAHIIIELSQEGGFENAAGL